MSVLAETVRSFRLKPSFVYLPIAQRGLPLARDLVIATMWRARRVPLVIHLHGSELPTRCTGETLFTRGVRFCVRGGHWLALSEVVADQVSTVFQPGSVTVIRNPAPATMDVVDTPRRPTLCWVGMLSYEKGFDLVLAAVSRLREAGVQFAFVVAGELHDHSLNPAEFADQYLGVVPPREVGRVWREATCTVLPSRFIEGQPFVLLEALQSRVAVGGTYAPGAAELFDRGAVATVEATPASVTSFVRRALEDPTLLSKQQERWELLRSYYDAGRVAEEFDATVAAIARAATRRPLEPAD